jgi:hypothetical protein
MLRRTVQLILFACLLATVCRAADSPFIGKWKLNPSKSKLADQMTIAPAGENKYTLTFAGAGETETLVADGTDQPGLFGSTASITIVGPGDWKFVRKQNGKVVITALWKLSADGKGLTDTFISYKPDGSASQRVVTVYKRAEGSESSSGIPGTWESTDEKVDFIYDVEIRPYQADGLSLTTPGNQANMRLDGKEYPSTGANASAGATSSSRRINDHTIEVTEKLNGKIRQASEFNISADGKTLTMTVHLLNQRPPNILVFDRE